MSERGIVEGLQAIRKDLIHATDRLCCDGTSLKNEGIEANPVIREGAVSRGMLVLGEIQQRLDDLIRRVGRERE